MNEIIVSIGANYQAEENLPRILDKLKDFFVVKSTTEVLITTPVGKNYKNDFHNQSVKLFSSHDKNSTREIFKKIEKELGRTNESKKTGLIPADIDIITWNGKIIHKDYERFWFVKKLVDELLHEKHILP